MIKKVSTNRNSRFNEISGAKFMVPCSPQMCVAQCGECEYSHDQSGQGEMASHYYLTHMDIWIDP